MSRPPNGWTAGVRNRPDPSPGGRKIEHVLLVPCRRPVHSCQRTKDDFYQRTDVLKPGATIGILGGGQLARMLALAAAPLGLRCHVFSPEKDSCAFDVVHAGTHAAYDDENALPFCWRCRRHYLRIRECPSQDSRFSGPAKTCATRSAGAGDNAGPPYREKFHQRVEDSDCTLRAGS